MAPRRRRGELQRDFRALLAPDFNYFSHASLGPKHGPEALKAFNALLAEREQYPGTLAFREILCFEQGDHGIVRYHSSGIVAGPDRTAYDGPAVILFHFSGDRIRGFEESLGWFDPAWYRR
ncbi:MAG: nuclear transport factor 2 family protein [Methylococcales bacterium]